MTSFATIRDPAKDQLLTPGNVSKTPPVGLASGLPKQLICQTLNCEEIPSPIAKECVRPAGVMLGVRSRHDPGA
jgi:hypothetical protein